HRKLMMYHRRASSGCENAFRFRSDLPQSPSSTPAARTGAEVHLRYNAIVFSKLPFGMPASAVTLGKCYTYNGGVRGFGREHPDLLCENIWRHCRHAGIRL